ncbi:MAG: hypothetical protein ACTSU2_10300, partial [Promethearchaeota archaeon]
MKVKMKSTLLLAIMILGVFLAPGMATVKAKGSESGGFNFDFSSSDPEQTAEAPDSLARALGGVFKVFDNLG